MTKSSILVVEDEEKILRLLELSLSMKDMKWEKRQMD